MSPPQTFTLHHRGCALSYTVRGEGPPVLLIQGVGVHGDGWLPQTHVLASRFRCITFDNRGVGKSQPMGAPITVGQMADDARAILDAAGVENAHIVGHSLGGLISLGLALEHRKRVNSLSLLCTFPGARDCAPRTLKLMITGSRIRFGARAMRRRAFLEVVMSPEGLQDQDRDALAHRLAPLFGHDLGDHPAIENHQLASIWIFDATPRLKDLRGIPTLVVSAKHDLIAPPASGRKLADGIKGARYVELVDASHGTPMERAERMNQLLMEHFEAAADEAGK